MSDPELIEEITKGHHTAFQWLFKEYYIGLCNYAVHFTRDKSAAEEMVQHVFYTLWEKRLSLNIETSVVAYLYRSVQNNCLNYLKHIQVVNKYTQYFSQKVDESEDLIQIYQESGLSVYYAKELEDHIYAAIENLPAQCREIFKLSRFEGLKHHEIAQVKGVSLNTVQKQISIALIKLRDALKSYL